MLGERMRAIAIFIAIFIAISFAILGCSRSGSEIKLVGKWTLDETDSRGTGFRSSTVIDDNGHYRCQYSVSTTNGVMEGFIEGVFKQTGELLVDTMTKHSNTNAPLPHSSKVRILSYDGQTLTLRWDGMTNPVVLQREQR